jgi:hypothetical protein
MPYLKSRHLRKQSLSFHKQVKHNSRRLIYSGGKIRFSSESDLEDYIQENFEQIFPDLILIKRQYSIGMQRCDLFCIQKGNNQAVIIELKNEEDRGIVSQLIRYRKAIIEEKSFQAQVDHSLPIILVAICPKFHNDNYTDKEASKYSDDLHFITFSIVVKNEIAIFNIYNKFHKIPYPIFGLPNASQSPVLGINTMPAAVHDFTSKLPTEFFDDFVNLRSLFLSQPKVKELVRSGYQNILYAIGDGETHRKLAEITNTKKGVFLYLWLPTCSDRPKAKSTQRFGIVMITSITNPFSFNEKVEYLCRCTSGSMDLKNRIELKNSASCIQASIYFLQACVLSNSLTLKNILSNDELMLDYKHLESRNPTELGWFINLAIKTWNYFVK